MELLNKDTTQAIIGSAFKVFNVLGYGFLVIGHTDCSDVRVASDLRISKNAYALWK